MSKKNITLAIFFLLISSLAAAESSSCDQISSQKDDFTNEIILRSPFLTSVQITKIKRPKKSPSYYLAFTTTGRTPIVDGTGVFVLFEDGKKWSKSLSIDVDVGDDGFEYSAFVPLTKADLKLFSEKKISKFKLYIFQHSLPESDASDFIKNVNCITSL